LDDSVEHVIREILSLEDFPAPGSASAHAAALLSSCSGGLQSIRPDDLVSHWFDTTATAFACASPRGRVIRVTHQF